ncbi:cytoskeleton-associated protein 2 isoform X2 [Canis lupus familiaris]|uniref:cytoskeleton-associated protein 2 isoform X2 n=2 Tax=Canis lupus familiaris TaxID=9615 RepID=UPI0015F16C6D|nr:cytoskeleton-associated protein 2 isoform X2 [Canis lupus familiaris]XP_038314146.1 cytoskeleton-associated protein 2 isoform X2 [Canis lupus familiaris]XP_038429035.1 cytoskeleton-associated protein 2 isoform X2 [Canis lupus familiaris]
MSGPAVPQELRLPPSQSPQPAFRDKRECDSREVVVGSFYEQKQKLKERMLQRKTFFAYKQENHISSTGQKVMNSEGQIQEETKVLKFKTKMAGKENVSRLPVNKNNITMGKNCIPLRPSNELANLTMIIDTHNLEDNNHTRQSVPIEDGPQSQHMTLSQMFHLKNNSKKKQISTEKPKQDANMPKKLVLGSYNGQIVQSKINSFRKPLPVRDESSVATKKLSATIPKAPEPLPADTSSFTVRSHRAPNVMTTTRPVSTASQDRRLVRPPIRSHCNSAQDPVKQGIRRSLTIRKGPQEKELLQLNTVSSSAKTSSQDVERKTTVSRSLMSKIVARPASSFNTRLIQKSKSIDPCRHSVAKATIDRSIHPKETAEERKARLSEWKASKRKMIKRPPSSGVTQSEPEGRNEKSSGSFWTTMVEEDEQRLFTEKVNKTFSECLNLINEGCPKEEILVILNDLIKDIPDAKKLVKYWICLARIEPLTSPIENIITIYEKAILAGAQPIEEMRHVIADILTMKSQEKVKYGENVEACATKEYIQDVSSEDIGVNLESGKPETEKKPRNVVFQDDEKKQDDKTKYLTNDVKTPSAETGGSCLIKYNVSTTPYLQSIKKKIQFDNTDSTFKELKFLTPVRRSQRIQEKTSKLPDMLKDHYPCVSSLEQLTELGGETDVFVCRPNTALCPMYSETGTAQEK